MAAVIESMARWLFRQAIRVTVGGIGLTGVIFGLIVLFQEKLVYVPNPPGMARDYPFDPSYYRLKFEDVWLRSRDGTNLHAWFIKAPAESEVTVLWLQENAGNMAYRLHFVRMLSNYLRCDVLMVMYRGYGRSEGTPSAAGLRMDAQAALDHLLDRGEHRHLVVFGRSLGGAVAIDLVASNEDKVDALVVENTFTCIADMAGKMFHPALSGLLREGKPLAFLLRNHWNSAERIGSIRVPLLMLASMQDEMVPFSQMQALHGLQRSDSCVWVDFPNAHHMTAYMESPQTYWPALKSFFDNHVMGQATCAAN